MIDHTEFIRVRYAETDRMGYVYYGNYAQYFEVARVEFLRKLGVSYRDLEDNGILLPVLDYSIRYHLPGYYDELLTIKTTLIGRPSAKIQFDYQTLNEHGQLINEAHTTLVFVDKETGKPTRAPEGLLLAIEKFIEGV